MNRRICVVTGSRAEYGLLRWVIADLQSASDVDLDVTVTGSHLSAEFGNTVQEIEADNVRIGTRVAMLFDGDTPLSVSKSIAAGVDGFAEAFALRRPDILVVLGDRFEVFAAAVAAVVANIPIAHIAGGDVTEGAIDEAFRHSITKMSHLHFVTNPLSAARVMQLGEDPSNVHCVGATGVDAIRRLPLLSAEALEESLGVTFQKLNFLVTFHPETLDPAHSLAHLEAILLAMDDVDPRAGIFFTMPNADSGNRALASRIASYVAKRQYAWAFASLGQLRYLSLMKAANVVVGNSSSGIYEAPSLHRPTVNVGDRQTGRLKAASVIDCAGERGAVRGALEAALRLDCTGVVACYGDGHASERISRILRSVAEPALLLGKKFRMVGEVCEVCDDRP
jgi:UDP-hydrolysing UDP-N-acetyl-D-glucosamine 2-epimerase